MPVKISVVIATYNSGPRLQATIDSLLGQSLPADEYEVVLVDDGSTDDTAERARGLAEQHSQVVAHAIEHTGWPGRPRNVGVDLARGEYVLFMDHDDDLFPEALERMHAFASAHDSDVLLAKEVVKGGGTPGWSTWRQDVGQVERIDQAVLECMTPHKLYRRQFLMDAGVRFPEGAVRLEDYHLNAQAYVRADVVSILASYPCYRWIIHATNSHKKAFDHDVYWDSFRESLKPALTELPPGQQQDEMLVRWYSSRVLRRVGPKLVGFGDAYRRSLFAHLPDVLPLFPPRLDAQLAATDRLRSRLLRAGDVPALEELSVLDAGTRLVRVTGTARWEGTELVLTARARIRDGSGGWLRLRDADGRLVRDLPTGLAAKTDPADDVRADLDQARVELSVRAVESAVEWPVAGSTGEVRLDDGADGTVEVVATARIDPATAAFGHPLAPGVWVPWLRVSLLGFDLKARIPTSGPVLPALVDGQHVVVFAREGRLAVDVGASARTVVGATELSADDVRRGDDGSLELRLPGVHVGGRTELTGEVILSGASHPAVLVGDGDGARVVTRGSVVGDSGLVRTRFLGERSETRLRLEPDVTVQAEPASSGRRVRQAGRRLVRRLSRV